MAKYLNGKAWHKRSEFDYVDKFTGYGHYPVTGRHSRREGSIIGFLCIAPAGKSRFSASIKFYILPWVVCILDLDAHNPGFYSKNPLDPRFQLLQLESVAPGFRTFVFIVGSYRHWI